MIFALARYLSLRRLGFKVRRLEQEHDNLRAALEWSLAEAGPSEHSIRLGLGLLRFWLARVYGVGWECFWIGGEQTG